MTQWHTNPRRSKRIAHRAELASKNISIIDREKRDQKENLHLVDSESSLNLSPLINNNDTTRIDALKQGILNEENYQKMVINMNNLNAQVQELMKEKSELEKDNSALKTQLQRKDQQNDKQVLEMKKEQ